MQALLCGHEFLLLLLLPAPSPLIVCGFWTILSRKERKSKETERGAVKTPTHSLYIHLHPHFSMIKKLRCNLSLYLFAAKSFYSLASSAHATPAKQGLSAAASLRMCPYFAFEFTTVPHTFLPTVKFVPLSLSTFYTP